MGICPGSHFAALEAILAQADKMAPSRSLTGKEKLCPPSPDSLSSHVKVSSSESDGDQREQQEEFTVADKGWMGNECALQHLHPAQGRTRGSGALAQWKLPEAKQQAFKGWLPAG